MGTREKLLETALAVFAEKGSDGGSMREIARRAGVNVATTYHHFGSKRELFLAVFRELGFLDTPDIESPPGKNKQDTLEQIIFFAWIFLSSGSDVIRLGIVESIKGDSEVLAVFDEWQRQGDGRIERELVRHGLATGKNSARRALVVRHIIWGNFIAALMSEGPLDVEAFRARAHDAAVSLVESWR